jgi:hypothetical protein
MREAADARDNRPDRSGTAPYFFPADTSSTGDPPFIHKFSTMTIAQRARRMILTLVNHRTRLIEPMFRGHLAMAIVAALAIATPAAHAEDLPLFRLFLNDGTTIACLGEFARVGDRVVFTLPLTTGDTDTQLTSLPANRINWQRTERYAESLRAVRYAETRGEIDFARLSGEVARLLNEIAFTDDPSRKLALARQARAQLSEWPQSHYFYRGAEVQQILHLVDEAISEMRASAGEEAFDLAFVANVTAPPVEALMPPPTLEESLQTALVVAERADDPAERLSLLDTLSRVLGRVADSLPTAVAARLRQLVDTRLDTERAVEADYTALIDSAASRAKTSAARADVRAVQGVIASVQRRDDQLGGQRPDRVAALLLTLQSELDAARRLRLAKDRWALRIRTYRAYQTSVGRPVQRLDQMSDGLDDIKRLAGPAAAQLQPLAEGAARAIRELTAIVPPSELASAHALFISAAHLAAQAVGQRGRAVETGRMELAWGASSAAAGSVMLLEKARTELEQALAPPELR